MDQGYNEEAAEQIQESKELLNTFKLVAEYFYHLFKQTCQKI